MGFVAHIKGVRSHQIVEDAYTVLKNMEHRGACGCEANTGDGAGMLTALPHEFLARVAREELQADLPEPGMFGAGAVEIVGPSGGEVVERHHLTDAGGLGEPAAQVGADEAGTPGDDDVEGLWCGSHGGLPSATSGRVFS